MAAAASTSTTRSTRAHPLGAPVTRSFYSPKPAAPKRKAPPSTPIKKLAAPSVPDYKLRKRTRANVAASAPRASSTLSPSHPTRASRNRNAKVDYCEDDRLLKRVKTTVKQAAKPRAGGQKAAAAAMSRQQLESVDELSDGEPRKAADEPIASGSRMDVTVASSFPSPPPTAKRPRDSSPTSPPSDLTSQGSLSHLLSGSGDDVESALARASPIPATAPLTPIKSTPRQQSTKTKAQRTVTLPTPDERERSTSTFVPSQPHTTQDHQGGSEAGTSSLATDRVEHWSNERMSSPAANLSDDDELEDTVKEIKYGAYNHTNDSAYGCILTPRRDASNRLQNLPVSRQSIIETPTRLQSQLNGYHLKPAEPSAPRFAIATPARRARAVVDPSTRYPIQHVRELLARIGGVVSGQTQPELEPPKTKGDRAKVAAWPFVAGYEEWEKPLRYAMESVVKDGVGNCLIALGPRGVGKTMLVERSLKVLEAVHGTGSFIPVRLNGLVHTTDRQALRSIARQLKCNGFSEEDGAWGSNAATMATLLGMLEPAADAGASAKPIIIIVDEFDLFALHPRQSFLYCLLDIVQGNRRKAGMGVIGLSARTDCLSILEKRVRSRCQSQVHQIVLPNSWDAYIARAKSLLRSNVRQWPHDDERKALSDHWNVEVEDFFAVFEVNVFFERLWRIHGNTPTHLLSALSSLFYALESSCQGEDDDTTLPKLDLALLPAQAGVRSDLLSHCSMLELTVCVAAKHVRNTFGNQVNLEMMYDCYHQHLRRGSSGPAAKPFSKEAFGMALDSLREREVFLPCSGKGQHYFQPSLADSFRILRFVPGSASLDAAIGAGDVPTTLSKWYRNWMN